MKTSDLTKKLREYDKILSEIRDVVADFKRTSPFSPDSTTEPEILESERISEFAKKIGDLIQRQFQLKPELESFLRENKAVVLSDPTLHRVAHEIRSGSEPMTVDDDAWWDYLLGRLDIHTYGERLDNLRPLLLLFDIPEKLKALVREAVEAYCCCLHTASIAVCRTLVEVAVVDIAVQIGRIKAPSQVREMRMCDRISSLIDKSVSKSSPLRRDINHFMESASAIIHGDIPAGEEEASQHLTTAFSLVQQLYGYYQSQYPRQPS